MPETIFANDLNYWKTSRTPPDKWLERACKQIESLGGRVLGQAFARDEHGRAAYMMTFEIEGHLFRAVWPVLRPKNPKDEYAAKIQAATMLYHDIVSKTLAARVLGVRAAFLPYLVLPGGKTAAQLADSELEDNLPGLFLPPPRE